MRPLRFFSAVLLAAALTGAPAFAKSRIKDIVEFEGVRENQLVGYGIVVGLNGTGDALRNAPFTKQSLEAMLERLGYRADLAANGLEALTALQHRAYDIVLMDVHMPELDGLAALFELRANPATERIPVIMMSGYAEFHTCIDARSMGADQVLSKPFAPSFLLEMVNHLLRR